MFVLSLKKLTSRTVANEVAGRGGVARATIGTRPSVTCVDGLSTVGTGVALIALARVDKVAQVGAHTVAARARVARTERRLAADARIAGQACAVVAAGERVVVADAVVLTGLAEAGEHLLSAQLARIAGQALARELTVAGRLTQATVLTRLRGAHVHRLLALVARVAGQTRAHVAVGGRRLVETQAAVLAGRERLTSAHLQLAEGAREAGRAEALDVGRRLLHTLAAVLTRRAVALGHVLFAVEARVARKAHAHALCDVLHVARAAVEACRHRARTDHVLAQGAAVADLKRL